MKIDLNRVLDLILCIMCFIYGFILLSKNDNMNGVIFILLGNIFGKRGE